jgi:hypothetical protein
MACLLSILWIERFVRDAKRSWTPIIDGEHELRGFVNRLLTKAHRNTKIHDASAHGIPVVATSLLAQQLGGNNGVQLLVAADPRKFVE